jgi:NCS2 family nucleobase:cation symporter-2
VAVNWIGGGAAARESVPSTFGASLNLAVGFGVLLITVCLALFGHGLLRSSAVFLGLLCGYLACIPLGLIDFAPAARAPWFSLPDPFHYGWAFNLPGLLIFLVAYTVTTIETVGDTLAAASAAGIDADDRRLGGAIMADGIGSFLGGLINAGPNTSFSQNVGLIPLTRVAATRVVSVAGVLLILLGVFPRFAAAVALLPEPVLGGAGLVMFGMVAAAGIRIMAKERLDNRRLLVVAVSLGIGLGSSFGADPVVGLFDRLPQAVRLFFSSGISTGTLSAVLLNLFVERRGNVQDR